MPTAPKRVGREFVKKYYTIMNKSPENLHCFYTDSASFIHDGIDSNQRNSISANGKMGIRDAMLARLPKYNEAKTAISHVETSETLNDCLIIQVVGEISYNGSPMRPFSQTEIVKTLENVDEKSDENSSNSSMSASGNVSGNGKVVQ